MRGSARRGPGLQQIDRGEAAAPPTPTPGAGHWTRNSLRPWRRPKTKAVPVASSTPSVPSQRRRPWPAFWPESALAALIARIYEVLPLICPHCGGAMRIIAFITFSADIHKIVEHIGADPEAPRITPARGPPPWQDCGAQEQGEGVQAMPDWDRAAQQPAPDYPEDQRTSW